MVWIRISKPTIINNFLKTIKLYINKKKQDKMVLFGMMEYCVDSEML